MIYYNFVLKVSRSKGYGLEEKDVYSGNKDSLNRLSFLHRKCGQHFVCVKRETKDPLKNPEVNKKFLILVAYKKTMN